MKTRDNFLDKEEFIILNQIMSSDSFPWFFQREQVDSKDDGFYFSHKLYEVRIEFVHNTMIKLSLSLKKI